MKIFLFRLPQKWRNMRTITKIRYKHLQKTYNVQYAYMQHRYRYMVKYKCAVSYSTNIQWSVQNMRAADDNLCRNYTHTVGSCSCVYVCVGWDDGMMGVRGQEECPVCWHSQKNMQTPKNFFPNSIFCGLLRWFALYCVSILGISSPVCCCKVFPGW